MFHNIDKKKKKKKKKKKNQRTEGPESRTDGETLILWADRWSSPLYMTILLLRN